MDANPDWIDLLSALLKENVRFIVVGAHAVAYYTEPRYTKDLDIWVEPTAANAAKLLAALINFGAPTSNVSLADFTNPKVIFQIGVEPQRIDILMAIDGVTFAKAWRDRVKASFGPLKVAILSKADLLRTKKAVGRPQDILDLARLSGARKKRVLSKRRRT